MIYMVEFDFSEPVLFDEWNSWYEAQIRKLHALPGFQSVQRFIAVEPTRSPLLAVYEIASADVFESAEYLAKGGRSAPGKWAPMMINWDRNIFAGMAPAVPMDSRLVMVDRLTREDPPLPEDLVVLDCVGLDHTVYQRGYAVCRSDQTEWLGKQAQHLRTVIFKPLWPQRRKPTH